MGAIVLPFRVKYSIKDSNVFEKAYQYIAMYY